MSPRPLTRRRALATAGALAVGTLAGCSADDGDGSGPTTDGAGTTGDGGASPTPAVGEVGPVALRTVATGFRAPLDLAFDPGSGRRYVADQSGLVSAVGPEGGVEPFLDLTDRVHRGGSETGLLGLALHPDFAENRRFYVRYSAPNRPGTPSGFDHTFVLSEFRAAADGARADASSERTVLEIPEPQSNHNAGSVAFGPDGLLYVGVGDGGGRRDVGDGHVDDWYRANAGGNGQDVTDNLLGSVLRIDVDEGRSSASRAGSDAVDGEEPDRPYGVPDDNPLVGEAGLDEHYAWGFRNPWRLSFDGEDLYVGDVGEGHWEEVDLVERGGNYGWNVKEGAHCFGAGACPAETPDGQPLVDPVVEYPHGGGAVSGVSVIGGYVYRGDVLAGLDGAYVFGDLAARGRLFVARPADGDGLWPTGTLPVADGDRGKLSRLLSFGRDPDGSLYVLGTGEDGGGVYELRPAG